MARRPRESEKLRAPFMYAFRDAARERDAKKKFDLRSDDGVRVIPGRRTTMSGQNFLSDSKLRELLSDDLAALLNTTNMESAVPDVLADLPNVRKSILNYGLKDLANKTVDETERIDGIRDDVMDAVKNYEPRLIKRTMHVERGDKEGDDLKVSFVVRSDMRADPAPKPVEFTTEVQLDTGDIEIK